MKIILLHGPNLNLIGSISADIGSRITLDKINTGIKRHIIVGSPEKIYIDGINFLENLK